MVNEHIVKIISSKMGVARGCHNGENAGFDRQQRNVKSSTAKIENKNLSGLSAGRGRHVKAVCKGSSSGLIDYAHDLKSSNSASIFCGSTLRVIEVRRDRDDGLFDRVPEVILSD